MSPDPWCIDALLVARRKIQQRLFLDFSAIHLRHYQRPDNTISRFDMGKIKNRQVNICVYDEPQSYATDA